MDNTDAIPSGKWLIIVNPNAGARRGIKDWPEISRLLLAAGLEHEVIFTEHRDHAQAIAIEVIGKGYRNIAVSGGDGTMNEVMNGIFLQRSVPPADIILGMIPVGTGNDWCRTFGIPFGYKESVELLKKKKTFLQDVGMVHYFQGNNPIVRYFMNIAGMGYDALVASKTNRSKEKGKSNPLMYFYFIFASLFQYKFIEAIIEIDGQQVFKGDLFSMNVGICKYNGGGMLQVPFAIPDDGIFDVTLIKRAPKWLVIRYARKLYDGSHVELPFISTYRGKTIRIRSRETISLEADGESLGHSPFVYEILHRSLRVVTGL